MWVTQDSYLRFIKTIFCVVVTVLCNTYCYILRNINRDYNLVIVYFWICWKCFSQTFTHIIFKELTILGALTGGYKDYFLPGMELFLVIGRYHNLYCLRVKNIEIDKITRTYISVSSMTYYNLHTLKIKEENLTTQCYYNMNEKQANVTLKNIKHGTVKTLVKIINEIIFF